MKYLFPSTILLMGLFCINCKLGMSQNKELKPLEATQMITSENDTILVGQINRKNLELNPTYNLWYKKSYDRYRIPENWTSKHKFLAQGLTAKLFIGTWCPDTHRELGSMIKILDSLGINHQKIEMYALTEEKNSPSGIEKNYEVLHVPTLIIFDKDKELNRIVEFPVQSLAQDLSLILNRQPYQHAYFGF
ncbi:MAG: thioredoxin family protein [Flavobacteriaceae bacterium]|nr:thioredoxin family protein [Flavobacteriaceae bacterium]